MTSATQLNNGFIENEFNSTFSFKKIIDSLDVFFNGRKSIKTISNRPYPLTITSDSKELVFVNLFNSAFSLYKDNFDNPPDVHINYDIKEYYGGGISGYRAWLFDSQARLFNIGKIKMVSENKLQLPHRIQVTDSSPIGNIVTYPYTCSDQTEKLKSENAVEFDVDITIYSGTLIQYPHEPGATVNLYFYPATWTEPVYPILVRLKKALRVFMGWDLFK